MRNNQSTNQCAAQSCSFTFTSSETMDFRGKACSINNSSLKMVDSRVQHRWRLRVMGSWLGFQSVKEFSRQHHPNGKFLPSDEEGNYPPSFSLKFLNVSVYIWSSITLCKKCWGAYVTPAVRWWIVLCLYSFALNRMSFRNFPLRYKRRLCKDFS